MAINMNRTAFAVLMISCQPVAAETIAPKDFDLACAIASSIELAQARKNTDEWHYAFSLASFYLGRLSGRDDQTYWSAVVKGRVAERRGQPNSEPVVAKCIEFFSQKLD